MLDRAGDDPIRAWRGSALHEEELARRAVRIALHDHRPIGQVRQQDRRQVGIELEQIAFGDSQLWPKRLLQIGEANEPLADSQLYVVRIAWDCDVRRASRCGSNRFSYSSDRLRHCRGAFALLGLPAAPPSLLKSNHSTKNYC